MAELRACASCKWQQVASGGGVPDDRPFRWCGNPLSLFHTIAVEAGDGCDRYRSLPTIHLPAVGAEGRAQTQTLAR